jgi:hypothetical protein
MVLRFFVDVHTTTKTAKQIPSGIKSKISYTPEDGPGGRNM